MLALYGHPFSSYTWKALIPLYANATPFEFRIVGPDQPENTAFVSAASPLGRFPVLVDEDAVVFEASAIVEYLHLHHPGPAPLLPADPAEALRVRMIDRVFDLSVMSPVQELVGEAIRSSGAPAEAVRERVHGQLARAYAWVEDWLGGYVPDGDVTLIECAAAPSLFYADWVLPIPATCPRLGAWRAQLLALPPVARCVEEARPYRGFFPLGAPERD